MTQAQIREAVGIFDNQVNLDKAVSELEATEFPRHDISVLGTQSEVKEKFGSRTISPDKVENDMEAPRNISVRPEEKTIGGSVLVAVPAYLGGCAGLLAVNPASNFVMLVAVAVGSGLGVLLGATALMVIRQHLRKRIDKQIRKGGLLLWVKTLDAKREEKAKNILRKHGARHVHINSPN